MPIMNDVDYDPQLKIGPAVAQAELPTVNPVPPIPTTIVVKEPNGDDAPLPDAPPSSNTPTSDPQDPQFNNAQPQSIAQRLASAFGSSGPTGTTGPSSKEMVSDYIRNKLQQGRVPQGDDSELRSARIMDSLNEAGYNAARTGDALYRNFAARANIREGGGGFDPGSIPSIIGDAPKSKVDALIQKRLQAQAGVEKEASALKDAAAADKSVQLSDINSPQVQAKLLEALTHDEESKRKKEQGDKSLGYKGDTVDQNDTKLTQTEKRNAEIERHNKAMEGLGNDKNETQKDKNTNSSGRLKLAEDKYGRDLAGTATPGIVYGDEGAVPKKDRDANRASAVSLDKLQRTVDEIKEIGNGGAGYESLPLSEKRMQLKAKLTELQPLLTSTSGMGNFTVSHQHLVHDILINPDSYLQSANKGGIDDLLEGIKKTAQDNVSAQVKQSPGGGRLARPGEAPQKAATYSASAGRQNPEDRVSVTSPDGKSGTIPRSQLKAAIAKGFKEEE